MKCPIATLIFALSFAAGAQTLARPGWVGSGLNVQPWWKHAVIYEIDTRNFQDSDGDGIGDLKGIAEHLDYLKTLGVDAILLDSLTPKAANTSAPIDPAFGTVDDFDDLSRESSRHGIRIIVSLGQPAAAGDPDLLPLARFWLGRGVAGVRLNAAAGTDSVSSLHRLVSTYVGQRILITNGDSSQQASGELAVNSALLSIKAFSTSSNANVAGATRIAMEQSQAVPRGTTPLLVTDGTGLARSVDRFAGSSHDAGVAKIIGTMLLLNRSASQIYLGQELGLHSPDGDSGGMPWGAPSPIKHELETGSATPVSPPPHTAPPVVSEEYVPYVAPTPAAKVPALPAQVALDPATVAGQDANPSSTLNFYRQLNRLRHGNSALRDGEQIMLNHDDLNALVWVRKPSSVTPLNPAIVIVCNLSAQPLVVPLKAELTRLHLRGSFLKTILRSDSGMGSMHLDPVVVPPFGVYVGELHY